MIEQPNERTIADLMAAHLLALSKATAVYQVELAKAFLQIEEESDAEDAGPLYNAVRNFEQMGLASSMFDTSAEGNERRARAMTGGGAALLESWLDLMHEPLRAYTKALSSWSDR